MPGKIKEMMKEYKCLLKQAEGKGIKVVRELNKAIRKANIEDIRFQLGGYECGVDCISISEPIERLIKRREEEDKEYLSLWRILEKYFGDVGMYFEGTGVVTKEEAERFVIELLKLDGEEEISKDRVEELLD